MSLDPTMGQSPKPLVSRLDASAANYITVTTSEGFLSHFYDKDEKPEPATKYNIDGGDHPKTSMVNQMYKSPVRMGIMRSGTLRCEDRHTHSAPPKQGKAKGVQKYALRSSSGVIEDHWKRTRGTSTPPEMGPGYYEPHSYRGMTGTGAGFGREETAAQKHSKTSSFAGKVARAKPGLNVMAMTTGRAGLTREERVEGWVKKRGGAKSGRLSNTM